MEYYAQTLSRVSWMALAVMCSSCDTINRVADDLTSPIRPSDPTLIQIWEGSDPEQHSIYDEPIKEIDIDLSAINAGSDHSREIEVVVRGGTALFNYQRFKFRPVSVILAHNEVKIVTLWRDFGDRPGKPQSTPVVVGYINGAFYFDIVSTRLDPTFAQLTAGFSQVSERAWFTGGSNYSYTGKLSTNLFRTGAGDVSYFIRSTTKDQ